MPAELSKVFVLAACGMMPDTQPLLQGFLQFLGDYERNILQHSIQCFAVSDIEDINVILGIYGCRKMPTGENIKQLLCEITQKN